MSGKRKSNWQTVPHSRTVNRCTWIIYLCCSYRSFKCRN